MSNKIIAIFAKDSKNGIGKKGGLPWQGNTDLKPELEFFKKTTLTNNVIMGRKTYESIGKPLPCRHNYVLTRNPEEFIKRHGLKVQSSFADGDARFFVTNYYEGIRKAKANNIVGRFLGVTNSFDDIVKLGLDANYYLIGGKDIYESFIDRCDEIICSHIKGNYKSDVKIDGKIFEGFVESDVMEVGKCFKAVRYVRNNDLTKQL